MHCQLERYPRFACGRNFRRCKSRMEVPHACEWQIRQYMTQLVGAAFHPVIFRPGLLTTPTTPMAKRSGQICRASRFAFIVGRHHCFQPMASAQMFFACLRFAHTDRIGLWGRRLVATFSWLANMIGHFRIIALAACCGAIGPAIATGHSVDHVTSDMSNAFQTDPRRRRPGLVRVITCVASSSDHWKATERIFGKRRFCEVDGPLTRMLSRTSERGKKGPRHLYEKVRGGTHSVLRAMCPTCVRLSR